MYWLRYPFVRLVLFLIAGILAYRYGHEFVSQNVALILLSSFMAMFLICFFAGKHNVACGVAGLVSITLIGYIRAFDADAFNISNHLVNFSGHIQSYRVVLVTAPQYSIRQTTVVGQVASVRDSAGWHNVVGKILLQFKDSTAHSLYCYGDELLVRGSPTLVNGPNNPGEFDYRQYLADQNIAFQHRLTSAKVALIKHLSGVGIFTLSQTLRLRVQNIVQQFITGDAERGVLKAFLVGNTGEIDDGVMGAYASTGVLHILSVSGLHVGLVYLVISFFLKPLRVLRHGDRWIALATIVLLAFYALIAGLSPSVLRSVSMFMIMMIARIINRHTNIYNTLCCSAFVLLLVDPKMLYAVGFQLSFLALGGIVYLQPRIFPWYEPSSWLMHQVWSLTSVSLAAQLTTAPLCIYYFHQFPTYFLLANIVVIPLSFIVLVGGLALVALNWIEPVARLLGVMVEWITHGMNIFIQWVDTWPWHVIDNLYLTGLDLSMLMALFVLVVMLFSVRKFLLFKALVGMMGMMALVFAFQDSKTFFRPRFTVFSIHGHAAIEFADRGHAFSLFDQSLAANSTMQSYAIKPARLPLGIESVADVSDEGFMETFVGARLMYWQGKYFLQIVDSTFKVPLNLPVLDYCIVSHNAIRKLDDVTTRVKVKKFILDASNSSYRTDALVVQGRGLGVNVFSVLREKAYVEYFSFSQ